MTLEEAIADEDAKRQAYLEAKEAFYAGTTGLLALDDARAAYRAASALADRLQDAEADHDV